MVHKLGLTEPKTKGIVAEVLYFDWGSVSTNIQRNKNCIKSFIYKIQSKLKLIDKNNKAKKGSEQSF